MVIYFRPPRYWFVVNKVLNSSASYALCQDSDVNLQTGAVDFDVNSLGNLTILANLLICCTWWKNIDANVVVPNGIFFVLCFQFNPSVLPSVTLYISSRLKRGLNRRTRQHEAASFTLATAPSYEKLSVTRSRNFCPLLFNSQIWVASFLHEDLCPQILLPY